MSISENVTVRAIVTSWARDGDPEQAARRLASDFDELLPAHREELIGEIAAISAETLVEVLALEPGENATSEDLELIEEDGVKLPRIQAERIGLWLADQALVIQALRVSHQTWAERVGDGLVAWKHREQRESDRATKLAAQLLAQEAKKAAARPSDWMGKLSDSLTNALAAAFSGDAVEPVRLMPQDVLVLQKALPSYPALAKLKREALRNVTLTADGQSVDLCLADHILVSLGRDQLKQALTKLPGA